MAVDPELRRRLLGIARAAIARAIGAAHQGERAAAPASGEPRVRPGDSGVFVSLHRRSDGDLRGCIGCFEGKGSLEETVARMAVEAATHDPRFAPVSPDELDGLSLEISVLSPMEDVAEPNQVEVGVHGLVASRGGRRGVLLPQVATENGWDREEFLGQT